MRPLLTLLAVLSLALPDLNVSQPSSVNVSQVGGTAIGQLAGAVEQVQVPSTNSAVSVSSSAKATLTTAVNVKASAGNVYGVFAMNGAASTCWIQLINSASAGSLGTAVILPIPLPASTTQPVWIPVGPLAIGNFSSGIAVGIATTATGSSACGTGGNVVVFYN